VIGNWVLGNWVLRSRAAEKEPSGTFNEWTWVVFWRKQKDSKTQREQRIPGLLEEEGLRELLEAGDSWWNVLERRVRKAERAGKFEEGIYYLDGLKEVRECHFLNEWFFEKGKFKTIKVGNSMDLALLVLETLRNTEY